MVSQLSKILQHQGFIILDGGLATELERDGYDLKDPLWSSKILMENPQAIQKVHEHYILSGADVIESASYQASFQAFANKGIDAHHARELFHLSVKIARDAVAKIWECRDQIPSWDHKRLKPLVAASLGPYGSFEGSEFRGNYGKTIEELMKFHRERIEVMLEARPDLLFLETVPCANEEANAIARLLKEEFSSIPAILSFTCKDGNSCCCGESFKDAVSIANSVDNIIAIGINCTSPLYVKDLLKLGAPVAKKLIAVYPNSGEEFDIDQHVWKNSPAKDAWKEVVEWYRLGARIIGGCCRTTPDTIKEIREKLKTEVSQ